MDDSSSVKEPSLLDGVSSLKKSTSVIEPSTSVKKAVLAKLPEENKDGWAMLE